MFPVRIVDGQRHNPVHAFHPHARLLQTVQNLRDLSHRSHHPRTKDGCRDQRTRCHDAVHHQRRPEKDHGHINAVLNELGPCGQTVGQRTQAQLRFPRHGVKMVPLMLETPFGLQRLDIVQLLYGFHQHGIAQRCLAHRLVSMGAQPPLRQNTRQQKQHQGAQRHEYQQTADIPEDHQEQQEERQIRESGNRGRGQHFAHLFEIAELSNEAAGGFRPRLTAHA